METSRDVPSIAAKVFYFYGDVLAVEFSFRVHHRDFRVVSGLQQGPL